MNNTTNYPMVPMRGLVIFPHMVLSFEVGRDSSIASVEEAVERDSLLFLVTQRDVETEEPGIDDVHDVGVLSRVKQVMRMPDGELRLIVEGISRACLIDMVANDPYYEARVLEVDTGVRGDDATIEAMMRSTMEQFETYAQISGRVSPEVLVRTAVIADCDELADTVSAHVAKRTGDRQELLEIMDPLKRMEKLQDVLVREVDIQRVEKKIHKRVKEQMENNQREYYLHEQLKAIQSELKEDAAAELAEFSSKLEALQLSDDIREKIVKQITRVSAMPSNSPEAPMMRSYIELLLDMPWGVETQDNMDIDNAKVVLDRDHYGLQDVKERVLEYLAVKCLTRSMKGPILCFVGPPGVGKTSIAKSVAHAVGRHFVRMSLGGVRDEAEIRGHRKTYIGAMPGRIISNIRQAGSMNPVFLFDEVDKIGSDMRGDPSAALLEVLDSEQNDSFRDHYMELPFDLSKVMFLATANTLDTIPGPLRDRMEIIRIEGYTDVEKLHIAKRHLVSKQMAEHGLEADALEISDDILRRIIDGYTREAGVRALERQIARVCRKAARTIAEKKAKKVRVTPNMLQKMLGGVKYMRDSHARDDVVGIATGLAWTAVGGELLSIEVNIMPGKGKLELTGQLGDVMKESAKAAYSYIRSNAQMLGIEPDFHEKLDIHIHVPEGATPKDGPSAGITMTTALVSALSGKKVSGKIAMTGEVTLRGRVLPIGGLKEKVLAAYREGIEEVLIPVENQKDVDDIPREIRKHIKIQPVHCMDEVLHSALV